MLMIENGEQQDYDDEPWTREELECLAWDIVNGAGWEGMDEYDNLPEGPSSCS
ncbi:MAG TPA: hypothetical protein VFE47_11520 [Tepidisphaeraceae bacterium]|jgi:hypothetical protein|nr:hypothetical protein [Tepidisphaeraceae bacterium]